MQDCAVGAEELGAAGQHARRRLSLLAVAPADAEHPVEVLGGGVVRVRTDCGAAELGRALREHGPAAAAEVAAQEAQAQELRELGRHVELRLRLRTLAWDATLEHEEVKEGCQRLLRHRDFLAQYLEGSAVRVAERNEVVPGSAVIDVAWDFEM